MLPRHEIDKLLITVTAAMAIADAGDAPGGYEVLLAGLHRVRDLFCEERWGAELEKRWLEAADRFAEQYRIGRA